MKLRPLVCVLALALVGSTVATTSAAASPASGLPTGGPFLQRWATTDLASDQSVTRDQALTFAGRYSVLTVKRGTFTPYLTDMHAANPQLRVLIYENAAFTGLKAAPLTESAYAHDSSNKRVESTNFSTYLMDVGSPAWQNAAATRCRDDLASASGAAAYDGCYFDMDNLAPLSPGYLTSTPINPRTGGTWTNADWITALQQVNAAVRAAIPVDKLIAGVAISTPNRYALEKPVLDGIDAGHTERWLRATTTKITAFPTETQWLTYVKMLADIGARGDVALVQTKLWVTGTAAQVDQWHRLGLASFLLAQDGRSYYDFSTGKSMAQNTLDSTYYGDIGSPKPTGTATPWTHPQAGVYRRDFTGAVVLVNTGTVAATVSLGGTFTDLDGHSVSSVSLPAHTGGIYRGAN